MPWRAERTPEEVKKKLQMIIHSLRRQANRYKASVQATDRNAGARFGNPKGPSTPRLDMRQARVWIAEALVDAAKLLENRIFTEWGE